MIAFLYKRIIKKLLFLCNPETVHLQAIWLGQAMGRSKLAIAFTRGLFGRPNEAVRQKLFGIEFAGPVGLAAGFDYEAKLTQILPALGFGFGTVGTLTNLPYGGNPRPMLGRLIQSRSLMVNKGFKNKGVAATMESLKGKTFAYPVGISIGKTNIADIKTQDKAVADVIAGFKTAEASGVPFAYYELNISCPNLGGNIEFYEPEHLEELLSAVEKLGLKRPVFIKMPISKTDAEVRSMLDIIVKHPFINAAIFGNLQRDRSDASFVRSEVDSWPKGNFSGKPCEKRSDELIALAYKAYGTKIKIIGCGGVFSTEDAYRKIKLGASLIQLITGMIFEGPQLISQINKDLELLLKKDGFSSVSQAVGTL